VVDLGQFRKRLGDDVGAMSQNSRIAFAAAIAERRMRAHEALPSDKQDTYVLSWRPTLNAVWRGLEGDFGKAFSEISRAVAAFYLSPQWHADGQDGPQDADNGAVSTTYYAAMEFMHGGIDFAVWAASAAADDLDRVAEDQLGDGTDEPDAWESELVQAEIAQQFTDAAYLLEHDPRWSNPGEARDVVVALRSKS
jgi:hypothetical protein